jgi:hypothetical protein
MMDPPRSEEKAGSVPAATSPPRMPRWVKWPLIVLGVLIALFLVLRFFGVEHGPGRHSPGGDPPASVAPGGHQPGGGH